jgi:tetratricopeptide (TPR) repeat protein
LTDVDLFSSYGLTQKAIDLLEAVLTRAPRHTPVLERLLDLSVGAGNDRRTVELASLLEQYATERNDRAASERYGELRRRFQRAAGLSVADAQPKPAPSVSDPPPEFAVPVIQAELDEPGAEAPPEAVPAETAPDAPAGIPMPVESVVHEVDLSDEWAALSQQIEIAMKEEATAANEEVVIAEDSAPVSDSVSAPAVPENIQPEAATEAPAFDLELQSAVPVGVAPGSTQAADALMADLAEDLESLTSSLGMPDSPAHAAMNSSAPSSGAANASSSRSHSGNGAPPAQVPVPMSGPLGDLFEEFRSELGESNSQGEDLETHYNLGIAYREMGLLEESISEFQKVASATDKGSAFRYAMQCSTLLGLAFMEKGQPAIAAIWYERALKTPGLDQESVLALRYDLGIAQELAGDKHAAFTSFSQVYAMNIDYRDVSERIALLGKAR